MYDNEDIILEQVDTTINGGSPTSETITYVHGPGVDEPLMMQKGGVNYYYHADALGSITELTDSTQAVEESYRYTSFGVTTKVGNTVNNSFRFTGREFDSEIGVYYYRARYYDPNIGRFISKDPIGIAGGTNLYNYVQGNPVNAIDPWGLWSISFDLYAGIGGGVTLGKSSGQSFISFRGGIGLGGGVTYDPIGTSPSNEKMALSEIGFAHHIGVGFLPFEVGTGFQVGTSDLVNGYTRNYDSGLQYPRPVFSVSRGLAMEAQGFFAAESTFYPSNMYNILGISNSCK